MRSKVVAAVAGLTLAATPVLSAALPADADSALHDCERKFDAAQRQDMESFRDYDRDRFRDVHHPDAVTVFSSGTVVYGRDNIMAVLDDHFTQRSGVWSWTELTRQVHGCKSAFIVYDATYAIAEIGYSSRTVTTVSYTYTGGRWLGILDASTKWPAASPS